MIFPYRFIGARRDFHCEVNAIARSRFEPAQQTTVYNYRLYKLDHIHGNSTINMVAKRYYSSGIDLIALIDLLALFALAVLRWIEKEMHPGWSGDQAVFPSRILRV